MKHIQTLLRYMKPHRGLFILDMLCATGIAVINLVYPYVSRIALYTWLPEQSYRIFFGICAILLAAYVLKSILQYVLTCWGHTFGIRVEADMRKDLFRHLQSLSFDFFDANRTGVLMSRVTSDLFEVVELAHHGPEIILLSSVTLIGALIVLYTISVKLAIIVTCMLPFLIVFVCLIADYEMKASVRVKESIGGINASIESTVSGMRTSKAFCNEKIEEKKFLSSTKQYMQARVHYHHAMGLFMAVVEFVYSIMPLTVLAFGGYYIFKGEMNYIDLVTFMLYINTFVTPLRQISNMAEILAEGFAGMERFREIMSVQPTVTDKDGAKALHISDGAIDFDHVRFAYSNEEILHDLSLHIDGGETLAIVGSSGGGKTTLCQLIPRFYDVTGGSIQIDGQNIKDIRQDSLRQQIGIVQQDVFLFADTVKENIRYGRPDATDNDIYEAAKKAEIYEDIMDMPNGFDTYVGERGVLLSGGQKQRISIARIFLKNPKILILDEATSALDSVTEASIQSAFDSLCIGRTTLIIAHRLSTIKNADRILVIDDGVIQEVGSHETLLKQNGIYANLYNMQNYR